MSKTTSGYGIQLSGNCPVVLCNILRGSVAEHAGIKAGDYLITFNGVDTQESTEDEVGIMIQESYGSPLKLRVARPHPLPVSSLDKRRALLTLQNKVSRQSYFYFLSVHVYYSMSFIFCGYLPLQYKL